MNYYHKLSTYATQDMTDGLYIRTVIGWGWEALGNCKYIPPITNNYFKTRFHNIDRSNQYRDKLTLEIDDAQCTMNGEYVTAIPWCDGCEFDFKDRICNAWCLFFGKGTVSFDVNNIPIYQGTVGLQGWGVLGRTVTDLRNKVPGIIQLDAINEASQAH